MDRSQNQTQRFVTEFGVFILPDAAAESIRAPDKNLFDCLEGSSSLEEFLEDFPSITRPRAVAVLEAARERLSVGATVA